MSGARERRLRAVGGRGGERAPLFTLSYRSRSPVASPIRKRSSQADSFCLRCARRLPHNSSDSLAPPHSSYDPPPPHNSSGLPQVSLPQHTAPAALLLPQLHGPFPTMQVLSSPPAHLLPLPQVLG